MSGVLMMPRSPLAPLSQSRRVWRSAVAIAVLILLASVPQAGFAPAKGSHSTAGLPLSPRGTASHPASMGLSARPDSLAPQGAPSPNYDEQLGTTFTQDYSSLEYNVTAVAQADSDGYGPGYLLNGVTTKGYWYQVGLSYHWPNSDGSYFQGFGFSYQVYGTDGKPVYPIQGAGLSAFSGIVNSGDSVLLSLNFSGPSVQMLAQDWNTGAAAETSYSSEGALAFVGDAFSPVNAHGFFTGLMTEWYHASAYYGNQGGVTYTNNAATLNSAWMWIDEFESGTSTTEIFYNQTQSPVTLASDGQVYPFAASGATMYISAHKFVTGLAGAPSRITLMPATTDASVPSFSATYLLTGEPQTMAISPGTTVLEADPGTKITVSINSSGSSALEAWVFSAQTGVTQESGTKATFGAGGNATFVYYHLVQEAVSYQVAGGGQALPASAEPELVYEVPPFAPSASPDPVTITQPLRTTPTVIFAIVGLEASINGTVSGAPGERWATSTQSWIVSSPDAIPNPIRFYQQYEVSVGYRIVGGGTPSQAPEFNSTAFGSPLVVSLAGNATTGWFDAGSAYSFTRFLNSSAPTERWQQAGGGVSANGGQGNGLQGQLIGISAPDETVTGDYVHQYYTDIGVNDPHGGNIFGSSGTIDNGSVTGHVAPGPGWTDAGLSLDVTAMANQGWQFEKWTGSGAGTYNGTSTSVSVTVTGPLSENATFYAQLAIAADAGTNIAYSYSSGSGTVQAGTNKTLYVPPSSNVTLRATPSLFVYSFASWQGAGIARAARPSVALVVVSPTAVTGTSSLDYPVILAIVAAAAIIVLVASLLIRNKRRRESGWAFPPA